MLGEHKIYCSLCTDVRPPSGRGASVHRLNILKSVQLKLDLFVSLISEWNDSYSCCRLIWSNGYCSRISLQSPQIGHIC